MKINRKTLMWIDESVNLTQEKGSTACLNILTFMTFTGIVPFDRTGFLLCDTRD